jgi:hypothetical protein
LNRRARDVSEDPPPEPPARADAAALPRLAGGPGRGPRQAPARGAGRGINPGIVDRAGQRARRWVCDRRRVRAPPVPRAGPTGAGSPRSAWTSQIAMGDQPIGSSSSCSPCSTTRCVTGTRGMRCMAFGGPRWRGDSTTTCWGSRRIVSGCSRPRARAIATSGPRYTPRSGACWDADRLDIRPGREKVRPELLSTRAGRRLDVAKRAAQPPDWSSIFERVRA